jgi:hypothetical protein
MDLVRMHIGEVVIVKLIPNRRSPWLLKIWSLHLVSYSHLCSQLLINFEIER